MITLGIVYQERSSLIARVSSWNLLIVKHLRPDLGRESGGACENTTSARRLLTRGEQKRIPLNGGIRRGSYLSTPTNWLQTQRRVVSQVQPA